MQEILDFWFLTLKPTDWYTKSDELDALIREKFEHTYRRVSAGEMSSWRDTPEGRLAEIIVLDQFTRNMFRGTPAAFSSDAVALVLAQEAVRSGADLAIDEARRPFVYMPYMHSESATIHEQAISLFAGTDNYKFELEHKEIIDRFGRYPSRNAILGRSSTPAEVEWLKDNKGF